ncbi:MAG TPA: hypothetical protein DCZ71_06935 [Ruminococcus sp.]|nr:hypothetical protein [Ruminococcus sp.]
MKKRRFLAAVMAAAVTFTTAPAYSFTYAADEITAAEQRAGDDWSQRGEGIPTSLSELSDTAETDTAALVIDADTDISELTGRSCTVRGLKNDLTIDADGNDIIVYLDRAVIGHTIYVRAEQGSVTFFMNGNVEFTGDSNKGVIWTEALPGEGEEYGIVTGDSDIPITFYVNPADTRVTLSGDKTLCGKILMPYNTLDIEGEGAIEVEYVSAETIYYSDARHGDVIKPNVIGSAYVYEPIPDNERFVVAYCGGERNNLGPVDYSSHPQREPVKKDYQDIIDGGICYRIYESGIAVVTGAEAGLAGKLDIPEYVAPAETIYMDGEGSPFTARITRYKVTAIEHNAFAGNSGITSVTMPEGLVRIGSWAFAECSELSDISIPSSVSEIGAGAFAFTKWLEEQKKKSPFAVVNGILIDGTAASGKVILPAGITAIGDYAFSLCKGITEVQIPYGVESIGEGAFEECRRLDRVYLPASVKTIGKNAFNIKNDTGYIEWVDYGSTAAKWKNIDIAAGNTALTIPIDDPGSVVHKDVFEDEYLDYGGNTYRYAGDHMELVYVRPTIEGRVEIPEKVEFANYPDYKEVNGITEDSLPVTKILALHEYGLVKKGLEERSAFQDCRWVTEVYIPESVDEVSVSAFGGCDMLETVIYGGTEERWLKETYAIPDFPDSVKMSFDGGDTEKDNGSFRGDANGDKKVNVADAVAVLQYVANKQKYPLNEDALYLADVDGQEGITGGDAIMIQQADAGIIKL